MENNTPIETIDNSAFSHFVGIKFFSSPRAYFFGLTDIELVLGDKVVVETAKGLELGEVAIAPKEIAKYTSQLGLKPIIRKANDVDLRLFEVNIKDSRYALEICRSEIERLKLDMNLISCEYTLDKAKVLFSYVADDRVDFRELLKILASKLHTRIELRQIGTRDKAKMVGGIGVCGLPICCSSFLNEFDGISIARAKNQMLAINIPKLSGHCGKLICCLKFEDEAYTEEKKLLPELGTKVWIDKVEYTITGLNIISKVIKIENAEDIKFLPLDEYKKQTYQGKPRKGNFEAPKNTIPEEESMPEIQFNHVETEQKVETVKEENTPNDVETNNKENQKNKNFHNNHYKQHHKNNKNNNFRNNNNAEKSNENTPINEGVATSNENQPQNFRPRNNNNHRKPYYKKNYKNNKGNQNNEEK